MTEFDYSPTVACNYGMSRNEVVRVLQGQVYLLRRELEKRDKVVDKLVERLPGDIEEAMRIDYPSTPWAHIKAQLVMVNNIQQVNQEIHDELRPVQADIRRRREAANAWDQTDG